MMRQARSQALITKSAGHGQDQSCQGHTGQGQAQPQDGQAELCAHKAGSVQAMPGPPGRAGVELRTVRGTQGLGLS